MTTPGRTCWAANCKSSRDKSPCLQFFTFPTDRTLSRQWCINSGCAHLTKYHRRALIRRGAVLCEKHFLPSQFSTPQGDLKVPKQLLWNAIPTVFPLPLKGPEEGNVKAQRRKPGRLCREGDEGSEEESLEIVTSTDKVDVEDYEMAALPTFGRERLIAIAKKQWHEIKRLRMNVRNLERALVSKIILDESYLLDLLQRNLEGPLLDRVTDIIVGDDDGESVMDEDA